MFPILVKLDQTGFIKNRYSHSNVQQLLNLTQFSQNTNNKVLTDSLVREKALDRVEWVYVFDVLKRYGLGSNYVEWVKVLYRYPTARAMVN